MIPAFIDLLIVLAEELKEGAKTYLVLTKQDRVTVRHALLNSHSIIIELFTQVLNSDSKSQEILFLKNQVCKAFTAWLNLGLLLNDFKNLLNICINLALTNYKEGDFEGYDDLCECIQIAFTSPDSFQYRNTIMELLPKILSFQSILEESIKSKDANLCNAVTGMICYIGENHTTLLLENYQNTCNGQVVNGLGKTYMQKLRKKFYLVLICLPFQVGK